jgi:hypothetical protein
MMRNATGGTANPKDAQAGATQSNRKTGDR